MMKKKTIQNKRWVTLEKQLGQTPLECLDNYRAEQANLQKVKMAYAGRLDPMAHGRLLVLLGETCKERDKYLGLDKEYEFEILLGVSSDTQDILGISRMCESGPIMEVDSKKIKRISKDLLGVQHLSYPAYSSKTVQGKPLFLWALENRLGEIEIPKREVEIYRLDYRGQYILTDREVLNTVHERIAQVTPVTSQSKQLGQDFRRKEVLETWQKNIADYTDNDDSQFVILRFRCVCSSGTYMRTLAQEIGQRLGTTGLAWSIHRTQIGRYQQWGRLSLWTKRY